MTKKCKLCSANVFTHNYCYYHRGEYYKTQKWFAQKAKKAVKPVSDKQKKVNTAKAGIKDKLMKLNNRKCFFCGGRAVDLVHIIRQGAKAGLRDKEDNCIVGCRDCHKVFDDGDYTTLKNIDKVLERMKELDEMYYLRFIGRAKS